MGKRVNWEKVREISDKIAEKGLSLAQGAKAYGTPVRQLYELNRRRKKANGENQAAHKAEKTSGIKQGALSSTTDQQVESTDTKQPNPFDLSSLPEDVQRLIIQYRTEYPDIGFKRSQDRLKSDHLVVVNRKQVRHVLKVHGLLDGHDSSFDRVTEPAKKNIGVRAPHFTSTLLFRFLPPFFPTCGFPQSLTEILSRTAQLRNRRSRIWLR